MSVRTSDSGNTAVKQTLARRKLSADEHKHPVNVVHHDEATFGEMLADKIASGIGSWTFLMVQTGAVITWLVLNNYGFVRPWDPFPFIVPNLLSMVPARDRGPVFVLACDRHAPQR